MEEQGPWGISAAAGPAWEPPRPRALRQGIAPLLALGEGGREFPHRHQPSPGRKQRRSAPALIINRGCLGTKQTLSPSSQCLLLDLTASKGGCTDRRPEEARRQQVAGSGKDRMSRTLSRAVDRKRQEASAIAAGHVEERERERLGLILRERGRQETPALDSAGQLRGKIWPCHGTETCSWRTVG